MDALRACVHEVACARVGRVQQDSALRRRLARAGQCYARTSVFAMTCHFASHPMFESTMAIALALTRSTGRESASRKAWRRSLGQSGQRASRNTRRGGAGRPPSFGCLGQVDTEQAPTSISSSQLLLALGQPTSSRPLLLLPPSFPATLRQLTRRFCSGVVPGPQRPALGHGHCLQVRTDRQHSQAESSGNTANGVSRNWFPVFTPCSRLPCSASQYRVEGGRLDIPLFCFRLPV